MDCNETQTLLHGYVDGELDLVRSLEIERHLHDCGRCAQAHRNLQTLQAALRGGSLSFQAPAGLQKRVQRAVRKANKAETAPLRIRPSLPLFRRGLGVAASLVLVALLLWGLARVLPTRSADEILTQEVIAGHVRSLMANHLEDVASSDQHTVKPWFAGKLDFSPPVEDFSAQGFPLIGGRLDYLDGRPVAALVYRRHKHWINLFIWPASRAEPGTQAVARRGYHLFHWTQAGMTYWAVSDLNERELRELVQLVQRRES